MSAYSDFSRNASEILREQARARGEAGIQKANLWGNVVSQLGQLPMQIQAQRQQERQLGLQEQAARDRSDMQRAELDQSKNRLAFDQSAEARRVKADELEAAKADLEMRKTKAEFASRILRGASPENWTAKQAALKSMLGEDPGDTFPGDDWVQTHIDLGISYAEQFAEERAKLTNEIALLREGRQATADQAAATDRAADNTRQDTQAAEAARHNRAMESRPTAGNAAERLVQIMGPNGTPIWVRESQAVNQPAAQAPRAVTGQERQSLAYYNRAKEAVDTLTTGDAGKSLEERMAASSLLRQGQLQYAPNVAQTSDQQRYRQAQRAFTEARLRKESGAAIPTAEYENDARTYFAQPGDSPDTIKQKRAARDTVLSGLKFGAGRAYDEFYGEPAGKATQTPVEEWERGPDGKLRKKGTR